ARENDQWVISGMILKDKEVVATFQARDIATPEKTLLTFTEEYDKKPPGWKTEMVPTLKAALRPGLYLFYKREFNKKDHFTAELSRKEGVVAREKPPAPPETKPPDKKPPMPNTDPIPSDDPNKLMHAGAYYPALLFSGDGKTLVTASSDKV